MIRHLLGEALELKNEDRASLPLRITTSQHCARAAHTSASPYPESQTRNGEELEDILKGCLKANDDRVHVAHGTWFISEEGMGSRHVSRTSLEPTVYDETCTVYYWRIADKDKVSQQIATLRSRIVNSLIGPKSSWPMYAVSGVQRL